MPMVFFDIGISSMSMSPMFQLIYNTYRWEVCVSMADGHDFVTNGSRIGLGEKRRRKRSK